MPNRLLVFTLVALAGCSPVPILEDAGVGGGSGGGAATGGSGGNATGGGDATGGGTATGGGSATGGGTGGGQIAFDGGASQAGCDVLTLMQQRCTSCHGNPVSQGAPMPLTTLAELREPSAFVNGVSVAQRCLARMQLTAAPMPPAPSAPPTATEIGVLQTWLDAGMPSCSAPVDAGVVDSGVADGGPPRSSSPNLLPQAQLFTCTNALPDAPTRLRRLNRLEFTRNVGGSVVRTSTGFSYYDNPFDPSPGERYSTYATDETLDDATLDLFLQVVGAAGGPWADPNNNQAPFNVLQRLRLDTSLYCMRTQVRPSPTCVRYFLSEFLEHGVLYREPTVAELDHLQAFATAAIARDDGGTIARFDGGVSERAKTITQISNAAWLTTGALFRNEFGASTDAGHTQLTDWEYAQALTYAIGARGPGAVPSLRFPFYSAPVEGHYAAFAGAAKDGGLRDAGLVVALVRANFGGIEDPLDGGRFDLIQDFDETRSRTRGEFWLSDGVAGFFREWLDYGDVATIFKERPEATSRYDDGGTDVSRGANQSYLNLLTGYYGRESTFVRQFDDAVARVVVEDTDVLRKLLTTNQFFVASTANPATYPNSVLFTGQPYNTMQSIADTTSSRWVTLPANERAGVLTHPAWLAAHGDNFEDDPSLVKRGKWVRENLLCGYVPPLSEVQVMALVGPHDKTKSARVRLDEATAAPQCQSCHVLMNSLGYPFETYNHAGYLRKVDHAPDGGWQAPSGASMLTNMPDPALNGPVADAVELSTKLSTSPHVKRCFIRQAFRYFAGRDETLADACTLAQMEQSYDASGGSFKTMLTTLLTSPGFKTRRVPQGGQ